MILNDFHGGLIKLGWVCHPNISCRPYNLNLFVYSLLTYGSNIAALSQSDPPINYRLNRLKAIREVSELLKSL